MNVALMLVLAGGLAAAVAAPSGTWNAAPDRDGTLEQRIAPPPGFQRLPLEAGSFGAWLRALPLKAGRPPVHLHDGRLKANQDAHWAVVDIDTGRADLQQCADAVMRLRAEYLFSSGHAREVAFDFTSGDRASFARWADGERPRVRGNRVSWQRTARADAGYASFRKYLDVVFTYAGSASLARELRPVPDVAQVEPGDVFIQGGFPGHAVIVVDVAASARGARMFLLAQSYMPAQEIHVLRNPAASHPWYAADFDRTLETPEWTFTKDDLRRF